MKSLLILFLLIFIFNFNGSAQFSTCENKVGVFGKHAGIDFNTGLQMPFATSINTGEKCASVSNSAGALQFYTDATRICRASGALMPTGVGSVIPVRYDTWSTTQAALIIPRIGYPSQYYVFSLESEARGVAGPYCMLWYCIVDMSLSGGLGDIVPNSVSATPFANNLNEKMTAVYGNSCNIWLLLHGIDGTQFLAYEITSAGVNATPLVSTIGTLITGIYGFYGSGEMKFSSDRTKLAVGVDNGCAFPGTCNGLELYDFNSPTGVVSNCRVLNSSNSIYTFSVEFSPDNTKLFSSEYSFGSRVGYRVFQYDISAPTTSPMVASKYLVYAPLPGGICSQALKLAPDGKVYHIGGGAMDASGQTSGYLDVISNPNLVGAACRHLTNVVNLSPDSAIFALPNIVISEPKPDTIFALHDTIACIAPFGFTITSHGTRASYLRSTGATTASATISPPGKYWVYIYTFGYHGIIDSIKVKQSPPDPSPVITGGTFYCYGVPVYSFTVSGTGILWYTSNIDAIGSTISPIVNTYTPGHYKYYATQTIACESAPDSIIVEVLPRISPNFTYTVDSTCIGGTVLFHYASENATHYLWIFGDYHFIDADGTTLVARKFDGYGAFSVKLEGYNKSCYVDTTITIIINYPNNPNFRITDVTPNANIVIGNSIQLSAKIADLYMCQPNDGSLDNSCINNPITTPIKTTTYRVLGRDRNGCVDSGQVG